MAAAKTCAHHVTLSEQAEAVLSGTELSACEQSFKENKCNELKTDSGKIRDCANPEDKSTGQLLLGCGFGLGMFVWDTAKSIVTSPYTIADGLAKTPMFLANNLREQERCHADMEYKMAVLEPMTDIMPLEKREKLAQTQTCLRLNQYVDFTARELETSIARKTAKGEALNDTEKKYSESVHRRKEAAGLMPELMRRLSCYKNDEAGKIACEVLATVLVPGAVAKIALSSRLQALAAQVGTRLANSKTVTDAEMLLGKILNDKQREAVVAAHRVGEGEIGKNGQPAGVGNYTEKQIAEKARLLKEGGFTAAQRRELMEAGIVGLPIASGLWWGATPQDRYNWSMQRDNEFQIMMKKLGHSESNSQPKDRRYAFKHSNSVMDELKIQELEMGYKDYAHTRKHYLITSDRNRLSAIRPNDPEIIDFFARNPDPSAKWKRTLEFSPNPEIHMSNKLKELLDQKDWKLRDVNKVQGTVRVEVELPGKSRAHRAVYQIIFCVDVKCEATPGKAKIVSFFASCGPNVFELSVAESLQSLSTARPGAVVNALKLKRCP